MSAIQPQIPPFIKGRRGTSHTDEIRSELIEMFDQRSPWPLILLNILLAGLLLFVWWPPETVHIISFTAISLVALSNIYRHYRYKRARRAGTANQQYWYRSFTLGTVANGLAWGGAGIVFFTPGAPMQSAIVLFLICGITAGVAASQAAIWPSVVAFALGTIIPSSIHIFYNGGPVGIMIGILLLIYLVYILVVGRLNHNTLADSIRLRRDNLQLMDDLASSEQYFRALVENTPDLVSVISADGRFLFESPSSEEILGHPAGSLLGKSALRHIHPDDHTKVEQTIKQVLMHPEKSANVEIRWRNEKGQWLLLDCVGRCLGNMDPPALVVNARDITSRRSMENELRKAKEVAEQASRIKSQFLATVSHEIRTPMHAILGMAEMLQKTALDNRQTDYVETFHSAGTHLLNLINDILDYSRLEAGGLQLASQTFNIFQLLDEVFAMLRPQATAKGLSLHRSVSPEMPGYRSGDPQRLQQILVNLIGNAIKFTPQGEINVRLEARGTERIYFAISDTGIGIAQEQQGKLFNPFTQLDVRTTREQGGTGLGLSICRHLVEAMGGKIEVDSAPGRGSCFDFTLDLPPRTVTHPVMVHEAQSSESIALASASILIADDALMNQRVMSAFLQDTPCRLLFANNGNEAVQLYREHQPAMVFMDMQMPQLDGGEATRQIRAFEDSIEQPHCPIVALSASAMDEDRVAALEAGCDEFFAKPLSQHQLFAVLRKYLK